MKVIIPALSEPITLEQARKQCKVDAEGSPPTHEDDELIQIFLSAAREWAEHYLGRPVAPTLIEIAFDSFAGAEIALESGPVLSVDSVTYLDSDGAEQTVDPIVYALDTNDQIAVLRLNTGEVWPVAQVVANVVKVRYVVGYSIAGESPQDAPLPNLIKVAILLVLGHLYDNRKNTVEKNLSEIPFGACALLSPLIARKRFA